MRSNPILISLLFLVSSLSLSAQKYVESDLDYYFLELAFSTLVTGDNFTGNFGLNMNQIHSDSNYVKQQGNVSRSTFLLQQFDVITINNSVTTYDVEAISMDDAAMFIDSLELHFAHSVASPGFLTDTIRVQIFDTINGNVDPTDGLDQTPVFTYDILTDTSLSSSPFLFTSQTIPVKLALAKGKRFAVEIEFHGDSTSVFNYRYGYRDACSGACAASPAISGENTFTYTTLNAPPPTGLIQFFDGSLSGRYSDCNGNLTRDDNLCEARFLQVPRIVAKMKYNLDLQTRIFADADSLCNGDTVNVGSSVLGDTGLINYQWTSSNGTILGSSTDTFVSVEMGLVDDTIQLIVMDAFGGNDTADVIITSNSVIVNTTPDYNQANCFSVNNVSTTLSGVTSGVSYLWNVDSTGPDLNGVFAGTYVVTVSNSLGCQDSDTTVVGQFPGLSINQAFHIPDPLCFNKVAELVSLSTSASSGWVTQFQFNNGPTVATLNDTAIVDFSTLGLFPGPLYITMTSSNSGCNYQIDTTVSLLPSGDPRCNIPSLSVNITGDPSYCNGDSTQMTANVTGASGSLSYSWSPTADISDPTIANPYISATVSTTYTVTVTDGSSTVTESVTVNPSASNSISFTAPGTVCQGDVDTIVNTSTLQTSNGWSPLWYFNNTPFATTDLAIADLSSISGLGTYTLELFSVNGSCQLSASQSVTVLSSSDPFCSGGLNVNISGDSSYCNGDSTQLTANVSGATGALSYSWSPTNNISDPSVANPYISAVLPTTYTVTVTDGSSTATESISVTPSAANNISFNAPTTICQGDIETFTNTSTFQSSNGWNPIWTFNGLAFSTMDVTSVNLGAITGVGTYMLELTVSNGACQLSASQSVTILSSSDPFCNSAININITGNNSICEGGNTQLTATPSGAAGPFTYRWSPTNDVSNSTIANPIFSPTVTTAYTVTVSNGTDSTFASQTITVTPIPDLTLSYADTTACQGASLTLSLPAGYSYNWSSSTSTTNTASYTNSGSYYCEVSNGACTGYTDTVTLTFSPDFTAPTLTANPNGVVCLGDTVTLSVPNSYQNYNWSEGSSGLNSIDVVSTGQYFVEVSNAGCTKTSNTVDIYFTDVRLGNLEFCVSAYDPVSGKIILVWDESLYRGIEFFLISKASSASGPFTNIGSVPSDQAPYFIDNNADLAANQYYQLEAIDSCGDLYSNSTGASFNNIGITATALSNDSIEINWNTVSGLSNSNYRIFGGRDSFNMSLIATVGGPSNSYLLTGVDISRGYYLQVQVTNPNTCFVNNTNYRIFGSGILFLNITGIDESLLEQGISIFPNPANEKIQIRNYRHEHEDLLIEIYDITGKKVKTQSFEYKDLLEISTADLSDGFYQVLVKGKELSGSERLIIRH